MGAVVSETCDLGREAAAAEVEAGSFAEVECDAIDDTRLGHDPGPDPFLEIGCGSVSYWFWCDPNHVSYPLGHPFFDDPRGDDPHGDDLLLSAAHPSRRDS